MLVYEREEDGVDVLDDLTKVNSEQKSFEL